MPLSSSTDHWREQFALERPRLLTAPGEWTERGISSPQVKKRFLRPIGWRAGVPSVVIPFFGDQPFWGRRMAELGVGPEPIPRKKLTADRLAQAIRVAVTDQAMRQRAAELGSKIRCEDGVASAVAVVQQIEGQVGT